MQSALAGAYLISGRYEEAIEWADRALHAPSELDSEPDDDDDQDDDAYQRLSRKAKKLAKRTGVSEAVAFSKIYEDPKYSDLVAATKRPVVRIEKSAHDAFAALMALAEQAHAAGTFPTVEIAFEKMLCAGDPTRRESVKRARGTA